MTDLTLSPAKTLELATDALDFQSPLEGNDPRWQDLATARGKDAIAELRIRYERKGPGRFVRAALLSHRGTGTTTELKRLSVVLSRRYRCLYLAANVEMDALAIEMEDLLLVLAQQIEAFMRETVQVPLEPAVLRPVEDFFTERVRTTRVGQTYLAEASTEIEGKAGIPFFGSVMVKLKGLFKQESEYRDEVKQVLRKYPGALMDAVNDLLTEANRLLEGHFNQELLLVIDNLDRYEPSVADRLLIQHGERFAKLACNLIVTPPIGLHYQPLSGLLGDHFAVFEMPSVRLRGRDAGYDTVEDPGRELLLRALGRRIDLDALLPEAAARDALVRASGASIRELLQLAQRATLFAPGSALTLADVQRAAAEWRGQMRDKVNTNAGWADALAYIAEHKQPSTDAACMQVLFHRLAFKYNGEGWYDIHPELSGLPEIVAARQRLRDAAPARPG